MRGGFEEKEMKLEKEMKTYKRTQGSICLLGIRFGTLLAMLLGGLVLTANATIITFDEIAPANGNFGFLTEEYASLGIHFITTDDGSIWGGMSAGDPGNWDLEGINGPAFLGFNGSNYGLTAWFDTEMNYISLDVSRSTGSSAGNSFTLECYDGAQLVDTQTVQLGLINSWTNVAFSGDTFDRVEWFGSGTGFHPYGIDNLNFVPEPATIILFGFGGLVLRRRK